jgi:hypothetical protein
VISQKTIRERARIYAREIRRLGFQKTHRPRSPEKEEAMVEAAAAFLGTFRWERDPDGVMRVKRCDEAKEW